MSRAVCCRLFNLAGVQHSAKQGIENLKIVLLPWHRTEWAVCSMGLLANGIFVQVPRYFNKSSGCMLSNYTEPELNARMLDRHFPGSSFVKKKLKSPKSVALVCQNKNSLEPFFSGDADLEKNCILLQNMMPPSSFSHTITQINTHW